MFAQKVSEKQVKNLLTGSSIITQVLALALTLYVLFDLELAAGHQYTDLSGGMAGFGSGGAFTAIMGLSALLASILA